MFFSERKLVWLCRIFRISLFAVLIYEQAVAQESIFIPASDDLAVLHSLSNKFDNVYEQETAALPTLYKKEMKEMYRLRHDNIKAKFDKKEIYTSPVATIYLEKLLVEIIKGNPFLRNQNIVCYFSKSGIPNASYLGEGMIIFNMGLLKGLDNESQAAFILCHELAHYYLQHSENSIRKYVTAINSAEVQQELRTIKKSQFNKRSGLEKLIQNITFDSRRHTRDHESQADSMAVEFLHNTRFRISESLTTLALLDSIDVESFHIEESLQNNFNAPGYPFKKRWLDKETGLLGGHAVIKQGRPIDDSLKTHPDCKSRIAYIEPLVTKYQSAEQQTSPVDKTSFDALKTVFEYEAAAYAFESGNYARSLFYTLELLEKKPADPYLVAHTGKIFTGFYTAQKKHALGKLIDLPSPGFPSNYNILLQFIQNLYLEDYAFISYHFLNKYQSTIKNYLPYTTVFAASAEMVK